jgi:hypothetical protein
MVDGKPAEVLGYTMVKVGTSNQVEMAINDITKVTPELMAMLHTDAGVKGTYEFPGADAPLNYNGALVMTSFSVNNLTSVQKSPSTTPPKPTSSIPNDKNNMNTKVDHVDLTTSFDYLLTNTVLRSKNFS